MGYVATYRRGIGRIVDEADDDLRVNRLALELFFDGARNLAGGAAGDPHATDKRNIDCAVGFHGLCRNRAVAGGNAVRRVTAIRGEVWCRRRWWEQRRASSLVDSKGYEITGVESVGCGVASS